MITPDGPAPGDDAVWAPRAGGPAAGGADASGTRAEPDLVEGYHDFTLVARGGDSVVYRARQVDLDREVAVKIVLLDDPETKARFRRELAITVRLGRQHPHIVTVLATGTTTAGQPCLVMDYFELGSLQDRLAERGALPISEVVSAGAVVADALSFAHGQGVLHRDVKPQNVLVLPTSYVLADFGLARAIDAGHSASLERFSYRHASPQVLDGEAPTTADDIYSLGSTLFTLLDGRPPFAADDPDEDSALSYLRRARTDTPRPLERENVPPSLAAIVLRCLSKQPADRFAGADELRDALEAVPTESRSWAPGATPLPLLVADPAPAARSPFAPAAAEPDETAEPAETSDPAEVEAAGEGLAPDLPAAPADPPRASVQPDVAPVAVSALAQLTQGDHPSRSAGPDGAAPHPGTPADVDATGLRPLETQAPPLPPARPRRWPFLAAAGVVALTFGIVIGLRNGTTGRSAAPAPSPSGSSSVSSPAVTAPSTSSSVAAPVPTVSLSGGSANFVVDQAIAPKLTGITRQKDRVTVTFTDRSRGQAAFVISGPDGSDPHQAPQGSTGITVVDQPAGRRCYYLTAYAPNTPGAAAAFRVGKSGPICTTS